MRHRVWLGLAALLFGVSLTAAAAQAQRESELKPFGEFKTALESALRQRGADPQRQTFHFVVLMNTVRTQGLGAQQMRNVYYGLLRYYLIGRPGGPADRISFVPYQLGVREEATAWNRAFSPNIVEELYRLPPTAPEAQSGPGSGHDTEAALLEAVRRASPTESTVFIVLSDAEVSATPRSDPNYRLTSARPEFAQTLQAKGIEEVKRGRFMAEYPKTSAEPQTHYAEMFYRIYLPATLRPLGELADKSRAQIGAETAAPTPPAGTTAPARPPGSAAPKPEPGGNLLPWLLGGLVLAGLAGAGLYLIWLQKPRSVQVNNTTGTVRYGQRAYIGGEGAGKNLLLLPELPKGQRIALLEVDSGGKVLLRTEGIYAIQGQSPGAKVTLKPTPQTLAVKNTHTRETVCQLNVKTLS